MKKVFKVTLWLLVVVIAGIGLVGFYVKKALPDVDDAPDMKVEITSERVERGNYLANHVMACMDCHSQRDWSMYAAPIKEGSFGAGGERFGREMQFPGTLYSANITPYALKSWTDGEIFRAITTGQNKHGKALFPLMAYKTYGKMDEEDVYSIIAYLRTIPAIKNDVPERELDFPVNFLVNTFPVKAALSPKPAKEDEIAYGKYLVTIGNCVDCHSQVDQQGAIIEGTEFGGGRSFNFPGGMLVNTPNITPDAETGIGNWTSELFVHKFKQYSDTAYQMKKLGAGDFNTPMPWFMYSGMDSADLTSIFKYLRSVKSIKNKVNRFVRQ